jgi:tRNA pseudouridine65 synthase
MKLRILLQDRHFLVVHKPAGILTYAAQGQKGAQELLSQQIRRPVYPVHRLDKDTCGILVFALSERAAGDFAALFRRQGIKKQYLTIVHDWPEESGTIKTPLEDRKTKVKSAAHTEYVRLATVERELEGEMRRYALLRCEIQTGRFHQIRRHMRSIGHPVCGDPEYGNRWNNDTFKKHFGVKRTLLSAVSIQFTDRATRKNIALETRPDPDFVKVVRAFGWSLD